MSGICSTHEEEEKSYKIKRRNYLSDIGLDETV
jgi:hypothetical protein